MTQVFVLGGVSYNLMIYLDALPVPAPQTLFARGFHETVGSTGAGKALNLSKLGLDVTLHGLIGADPYGARIVAALQEPHLSFLHDPDPNGTQRHVNLMDAQGRRISMFITSGAREPDLDPARLLALSVRSDYVVLNISNYCRSLIAPIRAQGRTIWCDIHDYDGRNPYHQEFIAAADYLFLSSDSWPAYRGFMAACIADGKALVVCTHGAGGATALTAGGHWIEEPILAGYALRDSNGAGDALFAGYLYGHAQGYAPQRCLRLGTVVAGLCITAPELAYPALSPALVEAEYLRHYGRQRST